MTILAIYRLRPEDPRGNELMGTVLYPTALYPHAHAACQAAQNHVDHIFERHGGTVFYVPMRADLPIPARYVDHADPPCC